MTFHWIKAVFVGGNSAKNIEKKASHEQVVKDATHYALSKYNKTFIDLAKYDRGEKIYDSVS